MESIDPGFPKHKDLWELTRDQLATTDLAHDQAHVLRVYRSALALARAAAADVDQAGAAALLHDLVEVPKESGERAERPRLCRRPLRGQALEAGRGHAHRGGSRRSREEATGDAGVPERAWKGAGGTGRIGPILTGRPGTLPAPRTARAHALSAAVTRRPSRPRSRARRPARQR